MRGQGDPPSVSASDSETEAKNNCKKWRSDDVSVSLASPSDFVYFYRLSLYFFVVYCVRVCVSVCGWKCAWSGVHEPDECLSIIIMGDLLARVCLWSAGTVEPGLGGPGLGRERETASRGGRRKGSEDRERAVERNSICAPN